MLHFATRRFTNTLHHSRRRAYTATSKPPVYHEPTSRMPELFTEDILATIKTRLLSMPRIVLNKPSQNFGNPIDPSAPVKRAAVLVPLVNWAPPSSNIPPTFGRERASIVYNLRSSKLRNHGGQVSFPGGKMDPEDEGDPIRTALRETAEEVGIETRFIQPLGLFHDVTSLNGLIVTPVVAFIPKWSVVSRQHVIVSEDEVEEIFEVPLTTLTDPGIYSLDILKRGVLPRYAVDPERREKDIWGMTAYISDWLLRSTLYNL